MIHLIAVITRSNMKTLYIDGLVQDCSNSIAIVLEWLQSCTKPSVSCPHGRALIRIWEKTGRVITTSYVLQIIMTQICTCPCCITVTVTSYWPRRCFCLYMFMFILNLCHAYEQTYVGALLYHHPLVGYAQQLVCWILLKHTTAAISYAIRLQELLHSALNQRIAVIDCNQTKDWTTWNRLT